MFLLYQSLLALSFVGWMFPIIQFVFYFHKSVSLFPIKKHKINLSPMPHDVVKSVYPSLVFITLTLFFIALNHLFEKHVVKLVKEQILFEFELAVAVFGWLRIIYSVVLACQKRPKRLSKKKTRH